MWGDDDDPEELEERSKKFKEEKADVVRKKKGKIAEKQMAKRADLWAKERQKADKTAAKVGRKSAHL